MERKFWTFGYRQQRLDALKAFLEREDALLVDVRIKPYSPNPVWRLPNLKSKLGERYVSLPEWGNKNRFTGGEMEIAKFEAGYTRLQSCFPNYKRWVLMCTCEDVQMCHRALLIIPLGVEGHEYLGEAPVGISAGGRG